MRQVWSNGPALIGIAAVDELPDFVVLNELATVGCGQAFFNFADKPLVVVHQTLNGLPYQGSAIAALLCGFAIQLGFEFRWQVYFHAASVGVLPADVNEPARRRHDCCTYHSVRHHHLLFWLDSGSGHRLV